MSAPPAHVALRYTAEPDGCVRFSIDHFDLDSLDGGCHERTVARSTVGRDWRGCDAGPGPGVCRRRARDDLGRILRSLRSAGRGVRAGDRPPPDHDARPVDGRLAGSDSCPPVARRGGRRGDHGRRRRRRTREPRAGAGGQQGESRPVSDRHGGASRRGGARYQHGRGLPEDAACGRVDRPLGQRQRHVSLHHAVCGARHRGPGGGQESAGHRRANRWPRSSRAAKWRSAFSK